MSIEKLNQKVQFVDSYVPYDFTENLGMLAVQIFYTNGNTQMLTTKSTKTNVNSSFEFENETEYFWFLEYLQTRNIPKKQI